MLLVLAFGLVAAACVPKAGETPLTTVGEEATTTTDSDDTTTTTTTAQVDLVPPERGSPDDVASDAFWEAGDFKLAGQPTLFEVDALETIKRWLPEELVEGLTWEVFSDRDDASVLAVSVIPALTWRGDPNFVPALIATLSNVDAEEISTGIYQTETLSGLILYAWSTGDGFVIATSIVADSAITYLEALGSESEPQQVWEPGACLYVDPDIETLPYAPFPPDIVVPCEGAHNAEVIISRQIGTNLAEYDGDAIDYDRNYECDKAYNEVFGPQKTHKPTLVTYMPDADEWNRGDRYLACVVRLETVEGIELIAGPMADTPDLGWNPEPGECFGRAFAPDAVECGSIHGYQYLGDADIPFDEWPEDGTSVFQDVCENLRDEFVGNGPAKVEVFATGLFPYAFEQGDRSVRCMAFAIQDGLLIEVVGSFDGVWRVIGSDGVAA